MKKLNELLPLLQLAPRWKTKGYTAIANSLIFNKKLSVNARLVAQCLLIRLFSKDHEKPVYPSYDTIASDLGISRRSVGYAVKELKEQKMIIVKHRRNKSSLYFLQY